MSQRHTYEITRFEPLRFLSDGEERLLNQIRGHGCLYMSGPVEEFILPFVEDHTREGWKSTHPRLLASLEARCPAPRLLFGKEAHALC